MVRIVAVVLAGYVAVGILVVLTDQIFAAAIPGFRTMSPQPLYYFVIATFTDTLYSVAGGYLCAAIAGAGVRKATLGLMVFGELLSVVAAVLAWRSERHWFGFALLILFPPAVWIGSRLRSGSAEPAMLSRASAGG